VGAELVLIEPDAELFPDLTPKALKKAQEAWRDDLFDRFWATYPRKVDKSAAYKSFCKAIEEGLTEQMLVDGMRVALGNWRETERQFIPYPSTWLNNKRWLDERDAPRSAADFAARAAAKRAAQPVEARERGGSP